MDSTTREAFFEWLNHCPCSSEITYDDYGTTVVAFTYTEQEDNEQ